MSEAPVLLDTCAFLDWALGHRMGKRALARIERAAQDGYAYLSAVSVQETMRLAEKGRLVLNPSPLSWMRSAVRKMRLSELSFTWEAALEAGALLDVNGDPVDRALLGSAIAGTFTFATRDDDLLKAAKRKGVETIDTRR